MNLRNARIALVGGAGLVGSHIVDALLREPVKEILIFDNFVRGSAANLRGAASDVRVRVVEGSITDTGAVDDVLAGIDGVFLLASLWLGECLNEPRCAWDVCTLGTWNVVEACVKHKIKRVVYSSSASVYGDAVSVPMTEEHPFNNRTMYGASKIACEQMLRATFAQHKLPYIAFRYMNIYGPRMDHRGVYVSVIMKVLDRIAAGKPPVVHGDGSQMYDFVYVEDVARANILGMQAECVDEAFNIGSGIGTSINELVGLLLSLTGSTLTPEYVAEQQILVSRRIGSTDKADRLLGFRATTPLADGLQKLMAWRDAASRQEVGQG